MFNQRFSCRVSKHRAQEGVSTILSSANLTARDSLGAARFEFAMLKNVRRARVADTDEFKHIILTYDSCHRDKSENSIPIKDTCNREQYIQRVQTGTFHSKLTVLCAICCILRNVKDYKYYT